MTPRRHRHGDRGTTLVELLVAMGIFGVLSSVVFAALAAISGGAQRVSDASDAQAGVWSAYTTLDQQVRYADAINIPGTAGGAAWVELRSTTPADASPRCYQWRYTPSTGALQTRSWDDTATSPRSSWRTVLTTRPSTAGTQPFTTVRAAGITIHQQLRVQLKVTRGGGTPSVLAATFVARNSSVGSLGNADAAPQDGVSDSPVCFRQGYRS